MANQLNFDVQFSRTQIEQILQNTGVVDINVYGNYEYIGAELWRVNVFAEGLDGNGNKILIASNKVPGCIRPCPVP